MKKNQTKADRKLQQWNDQSGVRLVHPSTNEVWMCPFSEVTKNKWTTQSLHNDKFCNWQFLSWSIIIYFRLEDKE